MCWQLGIDLHRHGNSPDEALRWIKHAFLRLVSVEDQVAATVLLDQIREVGAEDGVADVVRLCWVLGLKEVVNTPDSGLMERRADG